MKKLRWGIQLLGIMVLVWGSLRSNGRGAVALDYSFDDHKHPGFRFARCFDSLV